MSGGGPEVTDATAGSGSCSTAGRVGGTGTAVVLDAEDLAFFLRRDFLAGEVEDEDEDKSVETVDLDFLLDLLMVLAAVEPETVGGADAADTAGTVGFVAIAVVVGTGLDVTVVVAVDAVGREYFVGVAKVDTGTTVLTAAGALVVARR